MLDQRWSWLWDTKVLRPQFLTPISGVRREDIRSSWLFKRMFPYLLSKLWTSYETHLPVVADFLLLGWPWFSVSSQTSFLGCKVGRLCEISSLSMNTYTVFSRSKAQARFLSSRSSRTSGILTSLSLIFIRSPPSPLVAFGCSHFDLLVSSSFGPTSHSSRGTWVNSPLIRLR